MYLMYPYKYYDIYLLYIYYLFILYFLMLLKFFKIIIITNPDKNLFIQTSYRPIIIVTFSFQNTRKDFLNIDITIHYYSQKTPKH